MVSETKPLEVRSMWSGSHEVHFKVTKLRSQWANRPHLWHPPTDLYETETVYVVRVEIAGMEKGELNISLDGRTLAIYGVRKLDTERASYHQMEVRFGEFLSMIELPGLSSDEAIRAEYNDGFLVVTLPKVDA